MKILIIDAQGGGLGKQIITQIRNNRKGDTLIAVGTNSEATNAMRKAGADISATGENAVAVNARDADVIIGPIGIVIADSLYGEVTPRMALSVAQSKATRLLIPINRCENFIIGISDLTITSLIPMLLEKLAELDGQTA